MRFTVRVSLLLASFRRSKLFLGLTLRLVVYSKVNWLISIARVYGLSPS